MAQARRDAGPDPRIDPSKEPARLPATWAEARPTDSAANDERDATISDQKSDPVPSRPEPKTDGARNGNESRPQPVPHTDGKTPAEPDGSARTSAGIRRYWPWAAALILILGGAWWLWHGKGAAPAGQNAARGNGDAGVPVEVAEAKAVDLPIYYEGLGSVQAFNNVVVRSRVDGEIQKIAFQEGQIVKAGDILAQIDPRPYQAALDQALAKKSQDQATQASNRTDLSRTTELATRGFAARQQVDQQTATVGSIQAQIAMDQAMIDSATTQLSYATIRAPISGRTGLRMVDQGNIVRSSDQTGIVEIAQIDPIAVVFTAPEQQLPDIARAMRDGSVEVTALRSDGKSELAKGKLALINNEVDASSGTVRLKAVFENSDDRLWPGLSVNTRLLVRTLRGVVAIPDDAVQRGPKDLFVFVVRDGAVERRPIKVGPFTEGQAVVEDGLKAGEQVVTAGQSRLQDKTKVDTGGKREDVAKSEGVASTSASPGKR